MKNPFRSIFRSITIFVTLFSILLTLPVQAKSLPSSFNSITDSIWASRIGGTDADRGSAIATDTNGNIYTTGTFGATTDMDPGSGVATLTSAGWGDVFISKLDNDGNFVWAKGIGGTNPDYSFDMTTDSVGNVYTTGIFSGTVDFDPSVSTFNLTSLGAQDIFVFKLDTDGNFVWAKSMGTTEENPDYQAHGLAVDTNDNIYFSGYFRGTLDFDPGIDTFNLTSMGLDTFITKLDNNGNFIWVKTIGGAQGEVTNTNIAIDSNNNIYTTGSLEKTADFDPGPGTAELSRSEIGSNFIAKFDINGNYIWAKAMEGSGGSNGKSIAIDSSGNVYTAGSFTSFSLPIDLDPGPGTFAVTGSGDVFIAKLDSNGSFVWGGSIGGENSDDLYDIALDTNGNIYATGNFMSQTVDFDMSTTGIYNLTKSGNRSSFFFKLDKNGNFVWAKNIIGENENATMSLVIDSGGYIYTTGSFIGTADFDLGENQNNLTSAANYYDIFISKFNGAAPTVLSITRGNANPTNRGTVSFRVTFTQTVSGVDAQDFGLVTSGELHDASITSVSGSGKARVVTVNTGTGNGALRLTLLDNDSIVDVDSNKLGGAGTGNGNFTKGELYNINKTLNFSSTAAEDGWILESTETSNKGGALNIATTTLRVGDDKTKRQYRSILSFNTSSLPDTAIITQVILKVKKQGEIGGTNLVTAFQGFMVDIKTGSFGISSLEATDFEATASKPLGVSNADLVSNWYSINLTNGKNSINKLASNHGLTQIRLRFKLDDNNNTVENYLSLYSGNAPVASRPQLVIAYYVP